MNDAVTVHWTKVPLAQGFGSHSAASQASHLLKELSSAFPNKPQAHINALSNLLQAR